MKYDSPRIVMVSRDSEFLDEVTRLMESDGYIVTSTMSDAAAIDLAKSSDCDAVLMGSEIPQTDRRYVTNEVRAVEPMMPVIVVEGIEAVLTKLRQAGIR